MLGDRLLAVGGAKVVGALALACLVLFILLGVSVYANVLQFRGKARAVGEVVAQLAASEARAAAEIQGCAATNANVVATVGVLEGELLQCRGQGQEIAKREALALRQRDRARSAIADLERERKTIIEGLTKDHESDCNRPLCRALSDELLRPAADRPAQ